MAGRSSSEREALARQNAAIMAVFERAGFDHIAPDIIQPADIFLERSGEDIRARTFVFNDPDGNELCLRPDLTVPACRYHLSHAKNPGAEARYCYLGQAFRFPDERLSPQEFTQAGLEWFGGSNAIAEEARILKLTTSALDVAGLTQYAVKIGDLGLFGGLLDDMPMPERWRRRLRHQFWRPHAFHDLLTTFSNAHAKRRTSISAHVDLLEKAAPLAAAEAALRQNNLTLVGSRTLDDIAARLAEKLADRSEAQLSAAMVSTIDRYLAIKGKLSETTTQLRAISATPKFAAAVEAFEARIAAFEDQGLNPRRFHFDGNFGRDLEYYTGFVFQIEASVGNHTLSLAGGGRYDDLLSDLGAATRVPAVGCAIHAERVKAVLA